MVCFKLTHNGSADLRSPEKEVYFRSWDFANSQMCEVRVATSNICGCNPPNRSGKRSGADFATSGRGLAQAGIFTTKPATKPNTSNLRKTVKRSTEPPLAPNRCWQFVVFIRFSHLLFESKLNASVVVFTKLICPFLLLS